MKNKSSGKRHQVSIEEYTHICAHRHTQGHTDSHTHTNTHTLHPHVQLYFRILLDASSGCRELLLSLNLFLYLFLALKKMIV